MPTISPHQRLASVILGQPVTAWAQAYRNDDRSWRWIANRLQIETGGQVTVSGEAIRKWVATSVRGNARTAAA